MDAVQVQGTMRLTIVVLALLAAVGCGYSSNNYNSMTGGALTPTVSAIMPNSAAAGSAGFTLTVNGKNFGTDAVVYWNGTAHTSMYVSSAQVAAAIPASDVASAGMIPVYVRTGGVNSNTVMFNVQ